MTLRKSALAVALVSWVLITGCAPQPGPIAQAPPAPAQSDNANALPDSTSAFSEACQEWMPGTLEWRELSVGQDESADDAGGQVLITRSSLPPSAASRYNAGVEICPGLLWIVNLSGESRFLSVADGSWATGPSVKTSGRTDNIGSPGVESGGPVWGFRDATNAGEWLYLSDAVIDTVNECVRVDVHRVAIDALLAGNIHSTVIYESSPCVDYTSEDRTTTPIKTHMGGALAYNEALDELYVSLGDFHLGASQISQAVNAGLEATERDYALLLDDTSALSAVVGIATPGTAPESRIVAKGLRNSLGMTVDSDGNLWLTDHGPGGGDELNRISEGSDYGWPHSSEGQPYDRSAWPSNPNELLAPWLDFYQADVPGTTAPELVWSPAVGPSNIVFYNPTTAGIPGWQDNLIFGTLRGESLIRITRQPDGSLGQHRLPLGERIREVIVTSDGTLALMTDSSTLITIRG